MAVVARDADIEIRRLELGPFATNAYVLICQRTRESVLVDAPDSPYEIMQELNASKPKYILLTHNHSDHLGALPELKSRLKVPVAVHAADSDRLPLLPEVLLNDGDSVTFGDIKLEVFHTPGHTLGSLCFRTNQYLISGDTIFPGGPGKTGTPSDLRQIIKSITEKIFTLPDNTLVYPGHGDFTILKKEKDEFAIFSSRSHAPDLCGDVLWLSS